MNRGGVLPTFNDEDVAEAAPAMSAGFLSALGGLGGAGGFDDDDGPDEDVGLEDIGGDAWFFEQGDEKAAPVPAPPPAPPKKAEASNKKMNKAEVDAFVSEVKAGVDAVAKARAEGKPLKVAWAPGVGDSGGSNVAPLPEGWKPRPFTEEFRAKRFGSRQGEDVEQDEEEALMVAGGDPWFLETDDK